MMQLAPQPKTLPGNKIAVLLMAHGGPHSLDDVEPMLKHIMKHRSPTPEIIGIIKERYRLIGGKSPHLEITTRQAQALQRELNLHGDRFRVYVGMRHWTPFIKDAVDQIVLDHPSFLVAIPLAPHYSKISVGAYVSSFKKAWEEAGCSVPMAVIEGFHDHPLLLSAFSEKVQKALDKYPASLRNSVVTLFTAHALPETILADGDPYPMELEKTVAGIVKNIGLTSWRFAYQSRGMTQERWLGPEVEEVINTLSKKGVKHLLVAPIGFVSDHVEILYDVDILYKEMAKTKGIALTRSESLNTSERFVSALASLVHKHIPSSA